MSLECAGFARDFAMVEDQVRFLAGTLHDAGARRHGNRLQPGRSGFDSHRRLFQCNFKQATDDADAPAAHRPHAAQVRLWLARCVPSNGIESVWFHRGSSMAEHQATNLGVAGSSPVHHARMATRRESVYHEARGRRTYVQSAAVRSVLLRNSCNQSYGSNTDECHVVRGYRFHARSVQGWRKPVVVSWALPALTS